MQKPDQNDAYNGTEGTGLLVKMPEFASGAWAASTITDIGDVQYSAGQGSEHPALAVNLALHSACVGDLETTADLYQSMGCCIN